MAAAAGAQPPRAPPFVDPPGYARHRPESTLLYRLVVQHYPAFRELRAESGRPLPAYVQQEFESYLKCGRLEEGFLRVRCGDAGRIQLQEARKSGGLEGSVRSAATVRSSSEVGIDRRPARGG